MFSLKYKGIDSGEYSRTLMEAAQNALEHSNKHLLTPLQVLSRAHKKVEVCSYTFTNKLSIKAC
jgi:hypothetical protein